MIIDVKIVFLNKNYMNMNFSPTLPPEKYVLILFLHLWQLLMIFSQPTS